MMNELAIFAKYWKPGTVKTRLAKSVGDEMASRLHRQFLAALLSRFEHAAESCRLAFSPEESRPEFESLVSGSKWQPCCQSKGDLGDRLSAFFQASVGAGSDAVVVIGSDSPTMPLEYIGQAIVGLKSHDVVLGPTTDGGYYLVGISGPTMDAPLIHDLFQGIDWSTSNVWRQTTRRLEARRRSYARLPRWYDVDDVVGLVRLRDELLVNNGTEATYGGLLDLCEAALRYRTG